MLHVRRLALLLGLCGLPWAAACSSPRPVPRAQSDTAPAEVDKIKQLVFGQYAAIERGDLAAWSGAFAADVLLLGSDPGEVMLGRDTVLSRMTQSAGPRMKSELLRTYRSTRLRIGLTPDETAGWVADLILYRLQNKATVAKEVWFRMSATVAKRGAGWEILSAHYSVAVPDERAFQSTWPLPAEIPANPDPAMESIAAMIPEGPLDHFPVPFCDRADALLIGTSQEEWIDSGPEVQRFTHQGQPGTIRVERRGGVRTGLASQLSWAAWNGSLTLPGKPTLPIRVLSVFLKAGDRWTKVQEHVSIAVPD